MMSPNLAKEMLNARMISNASLNRDVLNVSSRYTGLENFSSEESLTCQLMSHVQDLTIN